MFRFLDLGTKALELETGVAVNEPVNYAIRTAIEFAVLQLIQSGEKQSFWKYKEKEIEMQSHTLILEGRTTEDKNYEKNNKLRYVYYAYDYLSNIGE